MKITVGLLLLLSSLIPLISADFDCQSINILSDTCTTELKCIYDEAYEGRPTSCRCKTVISTLYFHDNTLSYDLFEKVCSQHKDRLEHLVINDADLEIFDNKIFQTYSNLKYLNMAGNKIKINFSEAIPLLELDISSNGLDVLRPNSFDNLNFLKVLNMSFNRLEEVNSIFNKLQHLEEIYLNNNKLVVIKSDEFVNLRKLRILNLSYNFIVYVDGTLILPNLQELYLNNNKLLNIKKNDFNHMENIQILNFANNLISTVEDGYTRINSTENGSPTSQSKKNNFFWFGTPNIGNTVPNQQFVKPNLGNSNSQLGNPFQNFADNLFTNQKKVLNFNPTVQNSYFNPSKNNSSDLQFFFYTNPAPKVAQNLIVQTLKQNQEEMPKPSTVWRKLQELNLSHNKIGNFPESFFQDLGELRKLNVSYNFLTKFDLNVLGGSQKLISLDIRNNRLAEANLKLFTQRWPMLRIVDFDVNLIDCDQILDVLNYFVENKVVLKSCNKSAGCCGKILG